MISVVIPAKNEAGRIGAVLHNLCQLAIDQIIVVINGSRDSTVTEVLKKKPANLHVLYFHEPLGIDMPRALGAYFAYALGSDAVAFVDGDMVGTFHEALSDLIQAVTLRQVDMALTNCYPSPPRHLERFNPTFHWRLTLNRELGLEKKIYLASPAHGPHVISRNFMEKIPWQELALPPVSLALARKKKLKIEVGAVIPHYQLGSSIKTFAHSEKILDTIVGDCLEALCCYRDEPRSREYEGHQYIGYHCERRFDLLAQFLGSHSS